LKLQYYKNCQSRNRNGKGVTYFGFMDMGECVVPIAKLDGVAFDWAVAQAVGDRVELSQGGNYLVIPGAICWNEKGVAFPVSYAPTSSWMQGGPILDSHDIATYPTFTTTGGGWRAWKWGQHLQVDSTKLRAGLRCYLASVFGYEVTVPKEFAVGLT
jgi:hypothetical protein